jgi:HK97 family phage major capsid protein
MEPTLADLAKQVETLTKAVDAKILTPSDRTRGSTEQITRDHGGGAPNTQVGGFGQDSQPFSITKALVGHVLEKNTDGAKHEGHVLAEFRKALVETNSLPPGASPSAWFLPVNFDHLGERANQHKSMAYVKSVIAASGRESDPDEYAWLVRKGIIFKTQSAYGDAIGGALVPPPTMGPVIPLIRPEAAVMAAGATSFALPPNGRHVRPRITGAPSVQAVAESQDAPESNLSTDQMELSSRKVAGMARISEEATNYTSGTIDNYTKSELDRSLGLKWDAYALYGAGGTSIPLGIANFATGPIKFETDYATARGIGTNGNSLLPEYGDYLPALIGERSFNMDATAGAWIMRPGAYAAALGVRADATIPGDQAGPLVDILRRFGEGRPSQFRGRKVVQTTNIKGTLTKGTGTSLSDAFYGLWNHCIMATYGAAQFTQGHDDVSFKRGQFLMRGVMFGDVGFEYPAAFLYYTNLLGLGGVL